MLIRKNGKKVSVLLVLLVLFFVLEKNLYVLYNPVDEKDDENGDGSLAPHAVAAQTPDGGTAPDGGGAVESVDGETPVTTWERTRRLSLLTRPPDLMAVWMTLSESSMKRHAPTATIALTARPALRLRIWRSAPMSNPATRAQRSLLINTSYGMILYFSGSGMRVKGCLGRGAVSRRWRK